MASMRSSVSRSARSRRSNSGGGRWNSSEQIRARLLALTHQHDQLDAFVVQQRLSARKAQSFEAIHDERGVRRVALPLVEPAIASTVRFAGRG